MYKQRLKKLGTNFLSKGWKFLPYKINKQKTLISV
jgi:hypothetical protein